MNHFDRLVFQFKNKWRFYLLGIIIFIAAFLRFYNTPERYGFDPDATRDALISIEGARDLRFPLTGPISSIGPFTFGSWYYYQLILFKLLVPVDYSPWIYVGITSLVSVFIFYKIGEALENKAFGLLLASIAAISPGQLVLATGLSNPNPVLIVEVLSILIFIKILRSNFSYWLMFALGICLGIGINNHYQMIGLLILPFLLLFYKRNRIFLSYLIIGLGILITFIPLVLFNIGNHWETINGLFFYISKAKNGTFIPNSWFSFVGDFMPAYWGYILGVPKYAGGVLMVVCLSVMFGMLILNKLSKEFKVLFIVFLFQFIILRYFSGTREYYYFQYLQPFIFLLLAFAFWTMSKVKYGKYFSIICGIILIFSIVPKDAVQLHSIEYHLEYNNEAQALIHTYPNKKFLLYSCSKSIGRAEAISFLLDNAKKLGDEGIKIGFLHETCELSASKDIQISTILFPSRMLKKYKSLDRINAVDLTNISNLQLLNVGWHLVTPKTVFDRSTQRIQ